MDNYTHKHGSRRRAVLIVALSALVGAMLLSTVASAKVVYKWTYAGTYPGASFEGLDAIPHDGESPILHDIRIDQESNTIYGAFTPPVDFGAPRDDRLYKFNFAGQSTPFSAIEPNTYLDKSRANNKFAVDNSGGPTQGRIYVLNTEFGEEELLAYLPSGELFTGGKFPVNPSDFGPCGVAVGPTGNIWVSYFNFDQGSVEPNGYFQEYNPMGEPTSRKVYAEATDRGSSTSMCDIEVDSQGNIYNNVTFSTFDEGGGDGGIARFSASGVKHRGSLDPGELPANTTMAVDPSNDDLFIASEGSVRQYDSEGGLVGSFGGFEPGKYPGMAEANGVAVDRDTHAVYVSQSSCCPVHRVDKFVPTEPKTVPTAKTVTAEPSPTSATLRGIVNADGIDTTSCSFEWSEDMSFSNTAPCEEGNVFTAGSGDHQVHADIGGLTKGTEYHYRFAAANANGIASRGIASAFRASSRPTVTNVTAENVDTGGAVLTANLVPNGSVTHFQFEWGTEANNYTHTVPADPHPPANAQYVFNETKPKHVTNQLSGLEAEKQYHFRFVAVNDAGTTATEDQTFRTFAKDPPDDKCPNAHVRQQTGARLLLDCRAYELVSASNSGGYNVESDLSPGESPLVSSPLATDRLLYSLHFGSVPGIAGNPTDFGHDPYLAVRGSDGWTTRYVGLPADGMADPEPYGSPLLGSDSSLDRFAFGGENICEPCFADGSINVPIRRSDGPVEKGMQGPLDPAADPSGKVANPFSADGSHFIFGSDQIFENSGDASGSIYDRNLQNGSTQVISTTPDGLTMTGGEVGELGISTDGSRIVVGKKMRSDENGNDYWHPYLHIGTSPNTVDLAAGTTSGVLFAGMSADGTKFFYSTKDRLVSDDTDESADIYEATVSGSGPAVLSLVSVSGSGPSNNDICAPPDEWNTVSGGPNCSAVALAGGAGAAPDGTFYFLSPELLDEPGEGEANQPNLYVHRAGQPPHFVATLDTSVGKPPPPPPDRPVENAVFGGSNSGPEAITVDQSSEDVYVVETGGGSVARFGPSGAPDEFTAGPGSGTNRIPGLGVVAGSVSQVAVDNSPGTLNNAFYVNDGSKVSVFAKTGEKLGELDGSGNFFGHFFEPCGVAVDKTNGAVYIGDHAGVIWRYALTGSAPITDADYTVSALATGSFQPCSLAVDSIGNVYAAQAPSEAQPTVGGPVRKFSATDFGVPFGSAPGVPVAPAGLAIATDPATNELLVNDGSQIAAYTSGGATLIGTYGLKKIANSRGIAVNSTNQHTFAPNGSAVVEFGYQPPEHVLINHPAVVHALANAETHSYGDFQVTQNGRFAAFTSARSLTGFPTAGRYAVYRYDAQTDTLDCVSCPSTGLNPTADTTLPAYGLGLTDDGRVFFTTAEQLVLRDTNSTKDAYEWKEGKQQLISDGVSPLPSSLLTVTADGTDAFFFTNEVLAVEDQSGNAVKVYDARAGGGFPYLPKGVPCAASDECHGPGTQQPPAPSINTVTGAGTSLPGRASETSCRKGFINRQGKCKKKQKTHHRKHHRRRNHHG